MESSLTIKLPAKQHIASFDVDAQKTFTPLCPDELPVDGGSEIVAELNAQAQFAAYRLASKDAHSPAAVWLADAKHPPLSSLNRRNADVYWPAHAMIGSAGFELLDGLPPVTDYDFFVWKGIELDMHPYGACYHDLAEKMSTGAIEFLHENQVKLVIVGGLATDYCVKSTVLQLRCAQFAVIVNQAACRGVAPAATQAALAEMTGAGVTVIENAAQLAATM